MDRTYLFVPPEEKAEVQSLGARWDDHIKCWYIGSEDPPAKFSRWLLPSEDEEEFTVSSSHAYVAVAIAPCQRCRSTIEVICIHCESGTVSGEPLSRFTLTEVWAIDEHLAGQLGQWPAYHRVITPDGELGEFANHCFHCGAPQEDADLHSEPDSPFFDPARAKPGSLSLTPLNGTIRLSGNEHFTV